MINFYDFPSNPSVPGSTTNVYQRHDGPARNRFRCSVATHVLLPPSFNLDQTLDREDLISWLQMTINCAVKGSMMLIPRNGESDHGAKTSRFFRVIGPKSERRNVFRRATSLTLFPFPPVCWATPSTSYADHEAEPNKSQRRE